MNKTSVALGTFDGLHKGHLQVILSAVEEGKKHGFTPTVMLFDVHPQKVLRGISPPKLISDEKREEIIASLGAKAVTVSFAEISKYSKEEFFERILIEKFSAGAVSCGENYHFGSFAQGNADYLRNACEKNGIFLFVSPLLTVGGETVSSTRIRSFIQNGEIEKANEMLGRYFSYSSKVLEGKKLGRTLGIPTINQTVSPDLVKAKNGVYASYTVVGEKRYKSVTNIGVRPTVDDGDTVNSETHILGFSGNLYEKNPTVELVSYLREEKKFSCVEELREQIERDINKRKESE